MLYWIELRTQRCSTLCAGAAGRQLSSEPRPGEKPPKPLIHDHAHVALGAGETFDPDGDRFVRISFATSMPILDSLIDHMSAAVEQRCSGRPHITALDAGHDRF